jgi:EAL domain-containing protein (putative c-di-GMP-specific phosphodiesterase class I)
VPALFIPAAERAGVLTQPDDRVLGAALDLLGRCPHEAELAVSVNVGVEHLRDRRFADRIRDYVPTRAVPA